MGNYEKAFLMGVEGYVLGLESAPIANKEFWTWAEKDFINSKDFVPMMKKYIEGWTSALLISE